MDEIDRVHRTNATTPPPKFIMVGMEIPRGVRIYVSRNLPRGLKFGQIELNHTGPVLWHIETAMPNLLIVDGADWNEALARLFQRWANEDAADEHSLPRAASRAIDQPMYHRPEPESILPSGRRAVRYRPEDRRMVADKPRPMISREIVVFPGHGPMEIADGTMLCPRQRTGCHGTVTEADWKPFYKAYVCMNCVQLDSADVGNGINPPGHGGEGTLFQVETPWSDPSHDVMGDIREAMREAEAEAEGPIK